MKRLFLTFSFLILVSIPFLSFAGSTLLSDQTSIDSNVGGAHTIQDESSDLTKRSNLNFTGAGVSCVDDSGNNQTDCTIAGGSSGYDTIQEEGSGLTQRAIVNFIGADITCVDNGGDTRTDCTISGGGGGGFDVITSPATELQIFDEFISGLGASGQVGALGWTWTNANGGDVNINDSFKTGNILMKTDIGSNAYVNVELKTVPKTVDPASSFDILWILELDLSVSGGDYRLGFSDRTELITGVPNNGIYIERLAADTNWFYVTRSGASQTRSDSGVAISTGTLRRFRLRRKDASTISFSISGGSETDITTNIPTALGTIAIGVKSINTTAKTVKLDYFGLKITGLSR